MELVSCLLHPCAVGTHLMKTQPWVDGSAALGDYDLAFIAATFVQPLWVMDFGPHHLVIENIV